MADRNVKIKMEYQIPKNFYILNYGGGITKLVFMKKENNLWKVDKVISSDVYF